MTVFRNNPSLQSASKLTALAFAAVVLAGCACVGTARPSEPAAADAAIAKPPPSKPAARLPAKPPEPPQPPQPPTARTVYFDFDKSILKPGDAALLERHVRYLRDNAEQSIVVEGHCDQRGSREYNLGLGERRAQAVRAFLMAKGVPGSRIDTVSFGEERPADPGNDEAAWAKNRRVAIVYR